MGVTRSDEPTDIEEAPGRQGESNTWEQWAPDPMPSDRNRFQSGLRKMTQPFLPIACSALIASFGLGVSFVKKRPSHMSMASYFFKSFTMFFLLGVVAKDFYGWGTDGFSDEWKKDRESLKRPPPY